MQYISEQKDKLLSKMLLEKEAIESKIKIVIKNAYKKACKRDEELEQLDALLMELDESLVEEIKLISKEKSKMKLKLDNLWGCTTKDTLQNLYKNLTQYQTELNTLLLYIREVEEKRFNAQNMFDEKVPGIIVQARMKRLQENNKDDKYSAFQNRAKINRNPSDMKSLMSAATKQRSLILQLKQLVVELQQKKLDIGDQYCWLDENLEQVQSEPYVPEPTDLADVHLAHYINEAGITLDIKRISEGNYVIGKEHVGLKLVNDNLAIRIGGGFTNA